MRREGQDPADIRYPPASSHLFDRPAFTSHVEQPPRALPRFGDLSYFCFPATPPLSLSLSLSRSLALSLSRSLSLSLSVYLSLSPSWTPMETVASWHGEVNYKRYQSLGVVGRSVGLGSTDSQLPLRADPRARATVPSPLLPLSLLPTPPLFLLLLPYSPFHVPSHSLSFRVIRAFPSCSPPPRFLSSPLSILAVSDGSRQLDAPGAI